MKKIWPFLLCIAVTAAVTVVTMNIAFHADDEPPAVASPGDAPSVVLDDMIDTPLLCQYPNLPTGCESVAATMVLQYYGVAVTAEEFAASWLECSQDFYSSGGKKYGPDPDEVFAGDPFSNHAYGCFAGPVVNAVNRHSDMTAQKIIGETVAGLCEKYIDYGRPLLIWATMSMKPSSAGSTWYLEDNTAFTWIAGEHCLVLVGYNEDYYFFNDPMSGSTVAYQKQTVEKRFAELGSQAVFISPDGKE